MDTNDTEFVSSTIASFIDNITMTEWPDAMNTTYASELWTEYLTTLNSSFTDEYPDEGNETDELCYETRCIVIDKDEEGEESTVSLPSTTSVTTEDEDESDDCDVINSNDHTDTTHLSAHIHICHFRSAAKHFGSVWESNGSSQCQRIAFGYEEVLLGDDVWSGIGQIDGPRFGENWKMFCFASV